MTIKTYRKKPVHVQAVQLNLLNIEEVEEFVGGDFGKDAEGKYVIATLEGPMRVNFSDYVIKGIAGEFYPCKPDIFKATYEEIDQDGKRVNSTQYPDNPKTAMMTVTAVLEWLEGEKEDLEKDQKKFSTFGARKMGKSISQQIGVSIMTIDTLIEKLTKSTFEQMDEAYGNE